MSRRKKHVEHTNHERWLVSYADFITLLFAFFVVLYSSSQVDKRKVGQLSMAIQVGFQQLGVFNSPHPTHAPLSDSATPASAGAGATEAVVLGADAQILSSPAMTEIASDLEKALAPEISDHVIQITPTEEGLLVRLKEVGFYESGEAVLRTSSLDAIERLAKALRGRSESIRFEGHTDTVPIHNAQFDSNWELSTARASYLIKIFVLQYGYQADRLSAAGYAEFHPVTSNQTAAGRAQNRRIDIIILNSQGRMANTSAATAGSPAPVARPMPMPVVRSSQALETQPVP